ncbi:MAG: hypothetical protein LKCHEGNO_00964 [Burkholderiaceae bacterium]|nr:hypothetical protein [Burkholderiaceae bacterium]
MPPSNDTAPSAACARSVLLGHMDRGLLGLLTAWLVADGLSVVQPDEATPDRGIDLVILDVPFPRQGGVDCIAPIAKQHPDAPILAMSSTFFSGVECHGALARRLGVACVLPNPVARDVLIAAVRRVLRGLSR